MRNKISISSEVSLVEIILSVMIFAITGAIVLSCFGMARYTQIKAYDKTLASMKAQSVVEYIKSTNNEKKLEELLNGQFQENKYDDQSKTYIYSNSYDTKWNECDQNEKEFVMTVKISDDEADIQGLKAIDVMVERVNPYPFSQADKSSVVEIFSLETKKFFPGF